LASEQGELFGADAPLFLFAADFQFRQANALMAQHGASHTVVGRSDFTRHGLTVRIMA
jgi:hypothetical protein